MALALLLATGAVYAQSLGFAFVGWDDPQYVTRNPVVKAGLRGEGLAWAFTTTWMGSWHPLTWLSHMLDVELFGLDPAGHHATSAAIHGLNTVLLFGLLRAGTGSRWRSAVVAALFGLHPLHVESVAWVAERKDVLSTLLGLLALGAYGAYARRPSRARYLALVLLFVLSLMSKPMLVTLPVVLLLVDYWPLRRPLGTPLLVEKLPLLAVSAAFAGIALLGQQSSGSVLGGAQLGLAPRIANALYSAVAYLGQLLWPARLGMFYPHPYLPESGGIPPEGWQILACALALVGITAAALASSRRVLAVGWLWFLVTLLPVIGLVQLSVLGMADRYTYVPSIGVFTAATWGGARLLAALPLPARSLRALGGALAVAGLAGYGVTAWRQAGHWRDSLTLYERTLAVAERNPVIRFNYANELRRAGRLEEALEQYRMALEVSPDDTGLRLNLANALRDADREVAAEQEYREVLKRDGRHALAHSNLGSLLRSQGRLDEAERHYRRSLALSPRTVTVYNLANLLGERGDLAGAITLYEALLRKAPEARTHNNLGVALEAQGDTRAALRHYLAALELDPGHHRAHNNAGVALWSQGEHERAIAHFRRALEIEPGYLKARINLGTSLAEQGETAAAAEQLRIALEQDPDDDQTRALLRALETGEARP